MQQLFKTCYFIVFLCHLFIIYFLFIISHHFSIASRNPGFCSKPGIFLCNLCTHILNWKWGLQSSYSRLSIFQAYLVLHVNAACNDDLGAFCSAAIARIGLLFCATPVLRHFKEMTESLFGAATSWNGSVLQEIGTIAGNKTATPDGDRWVHLDWGFSRLAKDISSGGESPAGTDIQQFQKH